MPNKFILKSIKGLSNYFSKDELAFLSLTAKNELALRDRWAYLLYKELNASGWTVSREWNRVDLAIFSPNRKKTFLFELKALFTFDAYKRNYHKRYIKALAEDIKKINAKNPTGENIGILFVTHPGSIIPKQFKGIVKYQGINKALKRANLRQDKVLEIAKKRIENEIASNNLTIQSKGRLRGGKAYSIPIDVYYWMLVKTKKI